MADELVTRLVKANDWKRLDELFTAADAPNGSDYWRWKFLDHPWKEKKHLAVVTEDGDRLVSFFACLPMRFNTPDGVVKGNQVLDLMTHSDYMKKGIFRKEESFLAEEMLKRKHGLSVGFARQEGASIQGLFTMGYSYVCSLAQVLKVYDSKAFSASAANPMKRLMRGAVALRAKAQHCDMPAGVSLEKQAPKTVDAFLEDNKSEKPFSVVRNKDFLDWRCMNPGQSMGSS